MPGIGVLTSEHPGIALFLFEHTPAGGDAPKIGANAHLGWCLGILGDDILALNLGLRVSDLECPDPASEPPCPLATPALTFPIIFPHRLRMAPWPTKSATTLFGGKGPRTTRTATNEASRQSTESGMK
jgi:hypothetical protein